MTSNIFYKNTSNLAGSDYIIVFEKTSLWFDNDGIILLSAGYKGLEYLNFGKL